MRDMAWSDIMTVCSKQLFRSSFYPGADLEYVKYVN